MLNLTQQKWIIDKCNVILTMSKNIYDMDEKDWEMIYAAMNKYVSQSKGNPNVKAAILETESYIERMHKIIMGENNG